MDRSELLERICEALGVLTEGTASAILERTAQGVEVICHHGFGPAGLKSRTLPLTDSFASIIMSIGQTGYIEDVRQRPELHIPTPVEGEPFLSVLSTPLRIQGRSPATIEIYSHQARTWDSAQVSLIESLAAQASISIQNMELVENIRQERRRFETAFRTVPFGLAITGDSEGREIRVNPAAAAILGVPVGENLSLQSPLGARLSRLFMRYGQPVSTEELPLKRALRGEDVIGDELEYVSAKGTVSLLCCAAPILNGEGAIVGGVTAFADITTLKSLQRELELRRREAEEASLRKTRFLAAVSHDIRTPANAINVMAELIRRSQKNPEIAKELPELAERLQANTLSLMELISDVLDVARFDSGKVDLVESEFSLGDLIADECRQFRPLAEDKRLELIFEPMDRPIWLHTDRVKLGRIIGNLLSNAIKFTNQGSIRISCRILSSTDRRVEIRVTDSGIGIAKECLGQIFDEFAQLHNPERDRSKGTGLGLAICKRLIELMGGQISVESAAGVGSTFVVTMPPSCVVARLDATFTSQHSETKVSRANAIMRDRLAGLRLLLVEDHASTRDGTSKLLAQEGAIVTVAPTAKEALHLLEAGDQEVLLLDMMLPDLDGREVLNTISARGRRGLKGVIVLTGDLTAERLKEVIALGADGLIGKPVDIEKLIAALQSYPTM